MKRMAMILAIIAGAFLLASCAEKTRPPGIPAELRAIMSTNREIALPPLHPDFESIAASLLTADFAPDIVRQLEKTWRNRENKA